MRYSWLNKNNNKNLIVLFNGWAMNETPFIHLKNDGFDILMLNDYRSVEFDFSCFDFSHFDKKYLISWSMGVYASSLFKEVFLSFDKKIAINGTNRMIDNDYGIPEKIYKVTTKFLNEDSKDKFIKNMFDNGRLNPNITIDRDLVELKEELIKIQNIKLSDEITYDKAIISTNDRIVPAKNQLRYWQEKNTKTELIASSHCPFEIYSSWQELL